MPYNPMLTGPYGWARPHAPSRYEYTCDECGAVRDFAHHRPKKLPRCRNDNSQMREVEEVR